MTGIRFGMEGQLDGVKVGRILRQESEACANTAESLLYTSDLVEGHIVSHHNVSTLERRRQTLLNVSQKCFAVHRPLNEHRSHNASLTQAGDERYRLPAQRTAVIVKIYTDAFPNVIVGDAEPFHAISDQKGWQADYAKWVAAFHTATGTALSFTAIDFNWGDPHLNRPGAPATSDPAAIATLSRSVAQVLRANGLIAGMLYTGFGGGPLTDARWMAQAREHMDAVERSGIKPDYIYITSWDAPPTLTLPEGNPNALASLLTYYADHYRR